MVHASCYNVSNRPVVAINRWSKYAIVICSKTLLWYLVGLCISNWKIFLHSFMKKLWFNVTTNHCSIIILDLNLYDKSMWIYRNARSIEQNLILIWSIHIWSIHILKKFIILSDRKNSLNLNRCMIMELIQNYHLGDYLYNVESFWLCSSKIKR